MQKKNKFYCVLTAMVLATCIGIAFSTCYYIGKQRLPKIRFSGRALQSDPVLGFSRIPNSSAHYHDINHIDYYIYSNAIGAKVNAPHEKVPANVDILTIGCSFSEGFGLPNQQNYTSIVGERLHATTLNFAIPAYSGVGSLLMLERMAKLHPKIVIYGLHPNHLWYNVRPCASSFTPFCSAVPYIAFDKSGHPYIAPPVNLAGTEATIEVLNILQNPDILSTAWYGMRILAYNAIPHLPVKTATPEQINQAFEYTIGRMKAVTDQIGADLIVVYLPGMDIESAKPFPNRKLLPEGVHYIDTADALAARMRAEHRTYLYVVPTNAHPSAEAHAIIADEIVKYIQANKLLPDARFRQP